MGGGTRTGSRGTATHPVGSSHPLPPRDTLTSAPERRPVQGTDAPGLPLTGGRVPLPDQDLTLLLALIEAEEWLQGCLDRADIHPVVGEATQAHVELYALLCASEERHGASQAALQLAWLQGAATVLSLLRERRGSV